MEQEQQQQSSIFSFSFDETSKDHLKTISTWAAINAVLAFIGLALDIISFVMASNSIYYRRPTMFSMATENGFTLFMKVAISLVLNIFLFMASTQLKKGLQGMDNSELTKGFASLRTYYKIYGIVVIVMIILCTLGLLMLSTYRGGF